MDKANWFYEDLKKMNSGKVERLEETFCPVCKTQKSDFVETLFVGCPNCYLVFSTDVARAIENYHGSNEHVGKVPESVVKKQVTRHEIERLTKLKEDAVKREDYLLADSYMQKIKSLKGEGWWEVEIMLRL